MFCLIHGQIGMLEFETDKLVTRAVEPLKKMERIEAPLISVTTGQIGIMKGGVITTAVGAAQEQVTPADCPVPDVLAYLQNETELTRSTLVRILKTSGRLSELFNNPQRFMDAVATILKHELHRLLVDGIKYERIDGGPDAQWEMVLFKNEELINYLTALQVNKSIYEYVSYDSEVDREFAKRLDERDDIKLFVKLPRCSRRRLVSNSAKTPSMSRKALPAALRVSIEVKTRFAL
jgi:type III restriction enzyme